MPETDGGRAANREERERLLGLIADALMELEPYFDARCFLTLLVRAPHRGDGDILVTRDSDEAIIAAIQRLKGRDMMGRPTNG